MVQQDGQATYMPLLAHFHSNLLNKWSCLAKRPRHHQALLAAWLYLSLINSRLNSMSSLSQTVNSTWVQFKWQSRTQGHVQGASILTHRADHQCHSDLYRNDEGLGRPSKWLGMLESQDTHPPPLPLVIPFSSAGGCPTPPSSTPHTFTNVTRDDGGAPCQGPLAEKSSPVTCCQGLWSHSRCCPDVKKDSFIGSIQQHCLAAGTPQRTVMHRGRVYLHCGDTVNLAWRM